MKYNISNDLKKQIILSLLPGRVVKWTHQIPAYALISYITLHYTLGLKTILYCMGHMQFRSIWLKLQDVLATMQL